MESLERITVGLPLLAVALLPVALGVVVFGRLYRLSVREELGEKRNPAAAVFVAGYVGALAVAVSGTLFGRGAEPLGEAVLRVLGEGAVVVVLMTLSAVLHDKLLFRQFEVGREIREDRNVGAGFCMAGSLLASGLVLNGAVVGYSSGFVGALRDTGIFWLVGQVILWGGVFVHVRTRRHDLRQLIGRDDNPAVGLVLGSFLVVVGMVVRSAIGGSGFESLWSEVADAGVQAAFGIFVLWLVRSGMKVWMYPRVDLDVEISVEKNVSAAALVAGAYLATGILLGVVS